MSSFNQTYYLDIDSNYRDESVYPNPTDFTIPFKTNTSTGYYALGEPLNTESYFEEVSIDPNFSNDSINITNGFINNIKILDTEVYVCGVMYPGNTTFKYLNTGILSLTGVCSISAFLGRFDITELGDIPYTFNWITYTDSKTGNTRTSRSTFTFDLLDNIYFQFDGAAQFIDVFFLSKNVSRTEYRRINNTNVTTTAYPSALVQSPQLTITYSQSIFILYYTKNGDKGTYDNRDWGYHTLNARFNNLISSTSNGKFNISVDNGNNIITSFNEFWSPFVTTTFLGYYRAPAFGLPLPGNSGTIIGYREGGSGPSGAVFGFVTTGATGTIQQYNFQGYPFGIYPFSNTGGNYILYNMTVQYIGAVSNNRQAPYVIFRNTPTGPGDIINTYFLPIPVLISSMPLTISPVDCDGVMYLVIAYCRYNTSVSTSITYPINIWQFSHDMTTGSLVASSSGPITFFASSYPQYINNNIYIPVKRAEADKTFIMYRYNIPTNSMIDMATGSCAESTSILGRVTSWQQSGYIMSLVMDSGTGSANYFLFRYDYTSNILERTSRFISYSAAIDRDPYTYIVDKRNNGDIFIYTSFQDNTVNILDVKDPFNPTGYFMFRPGAGPTTAPTLCLFPYVLKDGTERRLLLVEFTNRFLYDVTDTKNTKFLTRYDLNPFINYISTGTAGFNDFGMLYSNTSNGSFTYQAIVKTPFFDKNITIDSKHFNINLQNTIPVNALTGTMSKFSIGNNNYFTLASLNNISIYNTLSVTQNSNIYNFNISLNTGSEIYQNKSYFLNNNIYVIISPVDVNDIYIYKSNDITDLVSPTINNFSLFYYTTGLPLIDCSLGFTNNNLLMCISSFKRFDFYRFVNNTPVVTFSYTEINPNLFIRISDVLYNTITNINTLQVFTNNTVLNSSPVYHYTINSTGGLSFFNTSNRTASFYKTMNLINNDRIYTISTKSVNTTGTSPATSLETSTLTNSTLSYFFTNTNSTNFLYFDAINYLLGILVATCYILSGITYVQLLYNNNSVVSTLSAARIIIPSGISIRGIQLFQSTFTLYLCFLYSDSTLYFYDITNITFANSNQFETALTSSTSFEYNFSSAFISKILQDGSQGFINFIGSSVYEPTIINKNISISNFDISEDYENMIYCGSWTNNVYFKKSTSTGYINTNYLEGDLNANNSYIINSDINGNNRYCIPMIGPVENILQRFQINDSKNTSVFVGYSSSKYVYIYNLQISGTLIMPTVIQKVINIISTSNGILLEINNTTGDLIYDLLVFTNDNSRTIQLFDLAIDENQISLIGTSTANSIRIQTSSEGIIDQVLYSNILYTNSRNIFFLTIDSSGTFLYSNLIDCGPNISIFIEDIKQDANLNRIYFTPYFTRAAGTGPISIYNRDGTLAKRDIVIGGTNFYSLTFQYLYDPLYTDKNGSQYSQVVYINPPSYPFIDENFNNYILFLIGNVDNVDVNGNYYVRYNEYDGDKYKLVLNTIIDPTTIIKQFSTINGITGSNNYFNMQLSSSYLEGYVVYDLNTVPNIQNQIIATTEIAAIDVDQFYYFMIPFQSSTGTINKLIPITSIDINSAGNYVFTVDNINDLRVSLPSGAFYGPYLPIVIPNDKLYSVIPFFGSSIFIPIYYNITLDSITLPNRPIKNLPIPGVRSFNDIPFFYVSIYPVDDEGNYDPETVNVVYTNTKLLVLPTPIFKIQSSSTNPDDNFVTFNSLTTPIIKFDKNYANLRITIYDPDGEVILFDTSPTKASDEDFLYGILPISLTNTYLRITLTKR
jgi:hypothetical protein